jgi:hypothetical protein
VHIKRHNEVAQQLSSERKGSQGRASLERSELPVIMEAKPFKSPKRTKDWGALPKLNTDPMKDEGYVRRLKMANYGKWYISPDKYATKVNKIN